MNKLKIILLLSLTLSIASGSFDLDDYLENYFAKQLEHFENAVNTESTDSFKPDASARLVTFAKSRGVKSAYQYALTNSEPGSTVWLTDLKYLAKTNADSAFTLAQHFNQQFIAQLNTQDFIPAYNIASPSNLYSAEPISYARSNSDSANSLTALLNHKKVAAQQFLLQTNKTAEAELLFNDTLLELAFYQHGYVSSTVLNSTSLASARFWFTQAQRLGHANATLFLAAIAMLEQDFTSANKHLIKWFEQEKVEPAKAHSFTIQAELLLLAVNAANSGFDDDQQLLDAFSHAVNHLPKQEPNHLLNQVQKPAVNSVEHPAPIRSCDSKSEFESNTITLVGTSLADLFQLQTLKNSINQATESEPLFSLFCVTHIVYLPIVQLSCESGDQQAIRCDEASLINNASSISSRYIALMMPKGGANVNRGILYFDRQDNSQVIVHELSHFLGFADEYQLPVDHQLCLADANRKSPLNIFAANDQINQLLQASNEQSVRAQLLSDLPWADKILDETPLTHWQNGRLVLGTPSSHQEHLGLFSAETCANRLLYKPLKQRTLLEYYQASFPALYLAMAKEHYLASRMPSYHYNIALATAQLVTSSEQSRFSYSYWLQQALRFEQDAHRQHQIKRANY